MTWFAALVLGTILLRAIAQFGLDYLNKRNVRAHAEAVPEELKSIVDPATYRRSVDYTLAKIDFGRLELAFDQVLLIALLFCGILPWSFGVVQDWAGDSVWAMAGWLFAVLLALFLAGLPFNWYAQFRLEQRFGFNTATLKLWLTDRLKGLLLAVLLGFPLLVLILKLLDWTGGWWWLWAWAVIMGFQLVMAVLAPVLILPLFNRLTPLPEGPLRDRLLALGRNTGFHARNILVMDGSKRSRHSNAFFTSLGRWRKIVLFDTLIQQLEETELEAVLAHEIGHYKKGHIPKLLAVSAAGSLIGLYALSWISRQPWFYEAFRFPTGNLAPAFLLFALLAGLVTFWLSPLLNHWSRRFEYQADAFAAQAVGDVAPLIAALRKLNEKNLSNLTPHPAYSAFYYSHPTLLEREKAMRAR